MAKSKYEFKKLKSKSLPAKIMDSTAVRVLAKAAKKLGSAWRKFITYSAGAIGNIKSEVAKVEQAEVIRQKIEENQQLVDSIKKDEQATAADFKVMAKAQNENEKLAAKLEKLLNKKVKVETKTGMSEDLKAALSAEEIEAVEEVNKQIETSVDDLNKAFDDAGVTVADVNAQTVEAQPVEEHKEEVKPIEQVAPSEIVTPAAPVANNAADLSQNDPVVSKVIQQLNNARQLAADNQNLTAENQRLTTESATKDQTIMGLQATVNSLTDANQKLTGDNDVLKQTNATQAVSIANLTKENDNLKSRTANQIVLEQKVSEYEGVITRHDKERAEMQKELDTLRITSRDNEARAKKLEADILKITRERDYYQSQIMALQNAIDFNPTAVNNTESRTR